jgi:hypothetical protein
VCDPPADFEAFHEALEETDALECYGDAELTFDAFWSGGPGGAIDGPCLFLEPDWFGCGAWVELMPPEAEAKVVLAATTGDLVSTWAAVHPDARLGMDRASHGNATVTGHFDDPAAQDCRFVPPVPDMTDDEAVDGCRHTFVVTVLEPL